MWERVGRLVCLWSAGEEHSKAEKAELGRKVTLAFLNQECLKYHLVLSLREEHKATGVGGASMLHPGLPVDLGSGRSQGSCCESANTDVGRCCLSFIFLGVSLDAACVLKMAGVEKERKEEGWQGNRRVALGPARSTGTQVLHVCSPPKCS